MANKDGCRDEEKVCNAAFEEGKKLGRKEGLKNKKNMEECAYENSWREGHKTGLEEGKEEQEAIHRLAYEEGKTNGQLEGRKVQTEQKTSVPTDSGTQMTTSSTAPLCKWQQMMSHHVH